MASSPWGTYTSPVCQLPQVRLGWLVGPSNTDFFTKTWTKQDCSCEIARDAKTCSENILDLEGGPCIPIGHLVLSNSPHAIFNTKSYFAKAVVEGDVPSPVASLTFPGMAGTWAEEI